MEKKSLVVVLIAVVLLGAGWGVHKMMSRSENQSELLTEGRPLQVIDVDAVVSEPEKFTGVIGVEGIVSKVDGKNSGFILGCDDACFAMPVKFEGRPPKEGTKVIAYGEVRKTEQAKYVFVAQEIKAK